MKKIAAILLLLLFAFNLTGFNWVLKIFQQNESARLEKQYDRNEFDESQLTEIVVPLSIPYYTYQTDGYERFDGELTIKGILYKYVQRKVANGNLYLKCIKANSVSRITSTVTNYFGQINGIDNDQPSRDHSPKSTVKKITDDFVSVFYNSAGSNEMIFQSNYFVLNSPDPSNRPVPRPELPPELS